jgi:hypothetical protein
MVIQGQSIEAGISFSFPPISRRALRQTSEIKTNRQTFQADISNVGQATAGHTITAG